MERFEWPLVDEFLDRRDELERLDEWWSSSEKMPINLYGRRRVGKSWLFRRFAHGKPSVLLVAHKIAPGAQLTSFADRLAPVLGVRPALADVPELFRVLFRAARTQKLLVVVDEFPWLLPGTEAGDEMALSRIQAVFEEEREDSKLKLILCGSLVGQMEALQGERSPLHGRLIPMQLQPMRFREASLFNSQLGPVARFERFAISGGMPRYLSALSGDGTTRSIVSRQILDRNAPLWNEARTVLDQELREAKVYFSILQSLATGDKALNEVAQALGDTGQKTSKYLTTLDSLRIVSRELPVNADAHSRAGHWHLRDPFFRFWFRFVFPYQDDLESGLKAADLYDGEVNPVLAQHVAPEFEQWCREWTRSTRTDASKVGAWWGPSLHALRRRGERSSEEIDVVGLARNVVTVVGEAKWQNQLLGPGILHDIVEYKVPALAQAGFRVSPNVRTLLFSKSGYTRKLREIAAADSQITLVDVPAALGATL